MVKKKLVGRRSNYLVSTPANITFKQCVQTIQRKLNNLDSIVPKPSPLKHYAKNYVPWDDVDEKIFEKLCNDMRTPFNTVRKEIGTYSDKMLKWFRRKDEFGHTITMYFPYGEPSYLLALYSIKTDNDSIIIDIFSSFPTSTIFYRVKDRMMMSIYLPFTLEGRYFVRKTLNILKKRKLVQEYTNSIVEYGYRPD